MKSYTFCPISDKKINERATRSNAILTVAILVVFGLTQNLLLLIFLLADFLLRATKWSKYSLIFIVSRIIVKNLPVRKYKINAGPKIFAARVGLFLTSLILVLFMLNISTVAVILAGILGLFSLLEGVFGICVACILYPVVYKWSYNTTYKQ